MDIGSNADRANSLEVLLRENAAPFFLGKGDGPSRERRNVDGAHIASDFITVEETRESCRIRVQLSPKWPALWLTAKPMSDVTLLLKMGELRTLLLSFVQTTVYNALIASVKAPLDPRQSLSDQMKSISEVLNLKSLVVLETDYKDAKTIHDQFVLSDDDYDIEKSLHTFPTSAILIRRRVGDSGHAHRVLPEAFDLLESSYSTSFRASTWVFSSGARAVLIHLRFATFEYENRHLYRTLSAILPATFDARFSEIHREVQYRSHIKHNLGNYAGIMGERLKVLSAAVGRQRNEAHGEPRDQLLLAVNRQFDRLSRSISTISRNPYDGLGFFRRDDPLTPDLTGASHSPSSDENRTEILAQIHSDKPFSLNQLLLEVSRDDAVVSGERARLSGPEGVLIKLKRDFVRPIFEELVRNASKHSIDGEVRISYQYDVEARVRVTVANIACELSNRDKLLIPGAGQRGSAAVLRNTLGTGQGLFDIQVRCRGAGLFFQFSPNLRLLSDWPRDLRTLDRLGCVARRFEAIVWFPSHVVDSALVTGGQQ